MDIVWQELNRGFLDAGELIPALFRLVAAMLLGAVVGLERERAGKPAGLRTHVLVCLGTALAVISGMGAGMPLDALARIIQGVLTGIGFIGAGAILKLSAEQEIQRTDHGGRHLDDRGHRRRGGSGQAGPGADGHRVCLAGAGRGGPLRGKAAEETARLMPGRGEFRLLSRLCAACRRKGQFDQGGGAVAAIDPQTRFSARAVAVVQGDSVLDQVGRLLRRLRPH